MTTVSLALVPIFLIILLGYSFMRLGFPGQEFWSPLEKVTYFVLFPCLLINNLATAPLQQLKIVPLATVLVVTILLVATLLIIIRPYLPVAGPEFTSIFQGSVRFNGYVCMAVVAALKIPSGLTLVAIALAAMIPVINILCVVVLAHYASHAPTRWQNIVQALLRNPLIVACLIGIVINWTGLPLPGVVQQTLEIIGRAALPFGLLAVGAGLCFNSLTRGSLSLLISMVIKLLLFPLLTWLMCHWFRLDAEAMRIAVLFTAVPTAASSYILARQMGGDYTVMANIITLQTVAATVTLPLVLTVLKI